MKKIHELERMSPVNRRRLLKLMGAALAAPMVPSAIRYAANELLMGKAYAQSVTAAPTYFIEIDLRDQWDHGHVFVAPSLARADNLKRGAAGRQAAIFAPQSEMKRIDGTDIYLTDDSKVLEQHVDTIAMIDCCELSAGDIHGHESANPLRSPGRTKEINRPGYLPMFNNERGANHPAGCEAYYGATPTPAGLHSHYSKVVDPETKVGIAFKGISRSAHTVYHYGAGLPNGEVDRIRSREELFSHFPSSIEDLNVLPRPEDAVAFTNILRRIDPGFLAKRNVVTTGGTQHNANLNEAERLLFSGDTRVVSIPLTDEERAYWSEGVPDQMSADAPKAEIWEQVAWAFKLVSNDLVRTVALEFDYVDTHDQRPENQVRVQAKQIALPLARLITKLKEAGLYDRTVIAVYTVDGSRSPAANSSGDEGKNTVILAGGMIRGGYFGDISVAGDDGDGHIYRYHMPDLSSGQAVTEGRTDNSGRVSGAAVWRTVTKALGIPDSYAQFSDVNDAKPLPFMLRA
ncbi:MAG: DUF1501 domain-containing protein [Clostridia bacterium]|nr:DUF1501 domain-containing protein [Deltaproteobacteria bacterium]